MPNPIIAKQSKIYIAGHRGLAGSALVRALREAGYQNLHYRMHSELDLASESAVEKFFATERPEYVFLAAAKVGGILANRDYPADFIEQNLRIQTNVLTTAFRAGVKRLLFLGSSCIYPKYAPQPMKEEHFLTGPLEDTNRAYAIAKIAGVEMCGAFNRQHGANFIAAMPTNLYGPGDNYDLSGSHVLPALIRKMHEARTRSSLEVVVWGTGTPRREFLHSEDMADACLTVMNLPDKDLALIAGGDAPPLINIGCGTDISIRELAELVAEIVGFSGQIVMDTSKPDGTPRKLLDISRLAALGWRPKIDLKEGIRRVYVEDYLPALKSANACEAGVSKRETI
jgi:GDP-L-fucose synthase